MRLFRKRILKLGNRGLSMVELICAIAIVSLLGTTVSSIMVVSANTYRRGAAETEVQQEAQLVANQISDLIIDTTKSVAVLSNQVTITQEDGTQIDIYLDGTTLKYKETRKELNESGVEVTNVYGPDILAEYVTSFTPDASKFTTNGSLKIGITIEKDGHTFPNYFTITARNAVRESIAEAAGAKVVLKIKKWLLEPCQSLVLNDSFAVASDGSAVTWSLDTWPVGESYDPETKLELDGSNYKLTIGKGETRSWVRAVAAVDGKQAYLTVFVRRVTGIDANATAVAGNSGEFKTGDEYKLLTSYTGNSMNQVTGAAYDTDYVDTRTTEITFESDGNSANVANSKAVINGNTLKLTADFEAGEYVLVKFTSKHAVLGVNKTGEQYDPSIYKVVKIGKTLMPPITITDNGWLRLSDDEQASVGDAKAFGKMVLDLRPDIVDLFIAANPGMTKDNIDFWHEYSVRYKKTTDSTWIDFPDPSGNGSDGMNSGSINIRPLINGSMDPNYDYDVEITWKVYAIGANNFKELLYSYSFGNTVAKVGTGFSSPYFGDSAVHYSWPISEAIDATGFTGNLFAYVKDSVTGVPKEKDIQNWLIFEVQKQAADGSWGTATGVQAKTTQGAFQIEQTIKSAGLYRVRVKIDFPDSSIDPSTGKVTLTGTKHRYNLHADSPSGNEYGVFYFKIEPKFKFYSSLFSIPASASVQGIPASSKKTITTLNRDQEVTVLTLDQTNSTSGIVDFNNLRYKLYKWDETNSAWVADTDISVNGSQEVRIRTSKEGLSGLYSLWLEDSSGNAMYNTSTGNGIFCFWIGSAGAVPEGAGSAVPSESTEPPSSDPSTPSSESTKPSSSESGTPSESSESPETPVFPEGGFGYSLKVTNAYNNVKQYDITITNKSANKVSEAAVVLNVTSGKVTSVSGNVSGAISADGKTVTITSNNYGNGFDGNSSATFYMEVRGEDGSFTLN